jgi:hypothetical protein
MAFLAALAMPALAGFLLAVLPASAFFRINSSSASLNKKKLYLLTVKS